MTAYGAALHAAAETAAAQLPGLTVPVVVTVDLNDYRDDHGANFDAWTVIDQL